MVDHYELASHLGMFHLNYMFVSSVDRTYSVWRYLTGQDRRHHAPRSAPVHHHHGPLRPAGGSERDSARFQTPRGGTAETIRLTHPPIVCGET